MTWLAWLLSCLGIVEFVGPKITLTFVRTGGPMSIAGTATVSLTDTNTVLAIASRPVVVTVGDGQPLSFDAINGPISFPCNEDDSVKIEASVVSKGGVASSVTSVTVVAIDKTTEPVAPGINFSFAVNPPAPAA